MIVLSKSKFVTLERCWMVFFTPPRLQMARKSAEKSAICVAVGLKNWATYCGHTQHSQKAHSIDKAAAHIVICTIKFRRSSCEFFLGKCVCGVWETPKERMSAVEFDLRMFMWGDDEKFAVNAKKSIQFDWWLWLRSCGINNWVIRNSIFDCISLEFSSETYCEHLSFRSTATTTATRMAKKQYHLHANTQTAISHTKCSGADWQYWHQHFDTIIRSTHSLLCNNMVRMWLWIYRGIVSI